MAQRNTKAKILGLLNARNMKRTIGYIKKNGIHGLTDKVRSTAQGTLAYHNWFMQNKATAQDLQQQRKAKFELNPKISIVVPLYNTPLVLLQEMMDSVLAQSYENWQLCLADGSPQKTDGQDQIDFIKRQNIVQEYCKRDTRICYQQLQENGGISENTNAAIQMATGDYIGLLDHDDFLEPNALYEVVCCLQDDQVEVVYTDEDKFDDVGKTYMEPSFKPEFNAELLRSYNYITHFFVVSADLIKKIGMLDGKFDGAQDYDFILRCTEQAKKIAHAAKIVYHWRVCGGSTADDPASKQYCYNAGALALDAHLKREGLSGKVRCQQMPGMYDISYVFNAEVNVCVCVSYLEEPTYQKKLSYEEKFRKVARAGKFSFVWYAANTDKQAFVEQIQGISAQYLLFTKIDCLPVSAKTIERSLGILERNDVAAVAASMKDVSGQIQLTKLNDYIKMPKSYMHNPADLGDVGEVRRNLVSMECEKLPEDGLWIKKKLWLKSSGNLQECFSEVRNNKMLLIYDAQAAWQMQ